MSELRLTILAFLLPFFLWSQSIRFKNFTTADGLLNDVVYNLYQDSQGYIWIFSEYGTLKYNGKEFKQVLKNIPLRSAFLIGMFENKVGRKWVTNSRAEVFEIRNDSAFKIKAPETALESLRNPQGEAIGLAVDDSLNMYLTARKDCYKLVRRGENYVPVNLARQTLPDSVICKLYAVNGNCVSLLNTKTANGLSGLNTPKKAYLQLQWNNRLIPLNAPASVAAPFRLFKIFRDYVYFAYGKFLGVVSDNSISYLEMEGVPSNFKFNPINSHLWISTFTNGVFELDENNVVLNHYLKGVALNDVLVDKNGGVWASTSGGGLYYCANPEQKQYAASEPLGSATSFIKQLDTLLFIGTQKGDVFVKSRHAIKQVRYADNTAQLDAMHYSANKFITVGPYSVEELELSPAPAIRKLLNKMPAQFQVFAVRADTFVAIWQRGLVVYKQNKVLGRMDFGRKVLTTCAFGDTVWLGTENGAYCYPLKDVIKRATGASVTATVVVQLEQPDFLKATKDLYILSVTRNNQDGSLWFSTLGEGIFRLTGRQLMHYSLRQGLPSGIINNIGFGPNKQVYLCANNGLYTGRIESNGSFPGVWMKLYNGSTANAVWFDKVLYVASNAGLILFNDPTYGGETQHVFCNLASVKINDRKVDPGSDIEVRSNEKSIEFEYDLIGSPTNRAPLCYLLYGSASDSAVTSNYNVRFSRLQPGEYVVKVYPLVQNGISFAHTTYFKVVPEFWQTAWFKLLVFLLTVAVITTTVFYFVNRRRKRDARNARQQQLIEQFKLVAIQAQINPHFMSNCLSAVQSLIQAGRNNEATFYVARFGLLVRRILDYSSLSLISLAKELELLEIYIELEQLRFENKFSYTVKLDDQISPDRIMIPPLLLHPLVENAVWHGLVPNMKKVNSALNIELTLLDNLVEIKVCDNGAGRLLKDTAAPLKSKRSYGIPLTRQRLESINFLYNTNRAHLAFNDLTDASGNKCGTEAIVTLPLNLEETTHGKD